MSIDAGVLSPEAIQLGLVAVDKSDAITQCGRLLLRLNAVDEPYLNAMHERERQITTYLGEGVAIPHGTDESRQHVRRTTLVVLQFPDGVDWDGGDVRLCVGIAAKGDEHIAVLSALARLLQDGDTAAELRGARDVSTVLTLLQHPTEEASA